MGGGGGGGEGGKEKARKSEPEGWEQDGGKKRQGDSQTAVVLFDYTSL